MTLGSAKKKLEFLLRVVGSPTFVKGFSNVPPCLYIYFFSFRNGSYVPEEGAIPIELLAPLSEEFK